MLKILVLLKSCMYVLSFYFHFLLPQMSLKAHSSIPSSTSFLSESPPKIGIEMTEATKMTTRNQTMID